jgi:CheY-like chemotaxis protein
MLDAAESHFPRLLIVDDDEIVLNVMVDMLEDQAYKVSTASTGYEALIKAQTFLPDLVLLDIKLEGQINGLETCTQLKSRGETKNIPVVFISGENNSLSESYRRGGIGFLLKPFTQNDLCEVIKYQLNPVWEQYV